MKQHLREQQNQFFKINYSYKLFAVTVGTEIYRIKNENMLRSFFCTSFVGSSNLFSKLFLLDCQHFIYC